jgi:hypothetical protein
MAISRRISKRRRNSMISVRGIYNGREIKALEEINVKPNVKVIITFLEDEPLIYESPEIKNLRHNSDTADPWDALDIESIAVDTGREDGSVNHDHYIYGTPKK